MNIRNIRNRRNIVTNLEHEFSLLPLVIATVLLLIIFNFPLKIVVDSRTSSDGVNNL